MLALVTSALNKFRRPPRTQATTRDIEFCYRLLLNRAPDPQGFATWKQQVAHLGVSVDSLVNSFLESPEFKLRKAQSEATDIAHCDTFQLFVRKNDYLVGSVLAAGKEYEPQIGATIKKILKPGDTFLDVGANIGYFSMLAAAIVGPTGHVVSFEPNLDNIALLHRSIAQNRFTQIEVLPYALSNKEGFLEFGVAAGTSNGRLLIDGAIDADGATIVRAVCGDRVLAHLNRIDVIKIDIEGAEPLALRGMYSVLKKYRPKILMEFSPDFVEKTSHINGKIFLEELQEFGYKFKTIASDAELHALSISEVLAACKVSNDSHVHLLLEARN